MATTAPGEDGTGPPDSVESRSHLYVSANLPNLLFVTRRFLKYLKTKLKNY